MQQSDVFFTDLRTKPGMNLLVKLERLARAAGFGSLDFKGKYTAIKIHFGEPGNLAYIRPNYVGVVSRMVREAGGQPFLTDANTLYSGRRHNAVDHLRAALENGFSRDVTGCDVIIADGLKGIDYHDVPVDTSKMKAGTELICQTAKIGSAVAEADAIIFMNHFKGHELTGFGGALKNIGMGCASRGGKLELHSSSKPKIDQSACTGCNVCVKNCAHDAITLDAKRRAVIDYDKCTGCGQCIAVCRFNAAQTVWNNATDIANKKIAEYSLAVVQDKPCFHISFVTNVSPDCDCWGNNDMPLVPDIGIFASMDPVALDQACVDAVNKSAALYGNALSDRKFDGHGDKFGHIHPDTDWKVGLDHAEAIGLGTRTYKLTTV